MHAAFNPSLTTQIYFAGHPLNDKDLLLTPLSSEQRASLEVAFDTMKADGISSGTFNLTLAEGRVPPEGLVMPGNRPVCSETTKRLPTAPGRTGRVGGVAGHPAGGQRATGNAIERRAIGALRELARPAIPAPGLAPAGLFFCAAKIRPECDGRHTNSKKIPGSVNSFTFEIDWRHHTEA